MAAIGKAGFLTDIIQVKIGKEQQILSLTKSDKFNIFFTGLAIEFPEAFGKIGITHIAAVCKLLNLAGRWVRNLEKKLVNYQPASDR